MFHPLVLNNKSQLTLPFQCKILKFLGVWPLNDNIAYKNYNNLYYCWSFIIILLITLTCYVQFLYFIYNFDDIINSTECGCTVLMGVHNMLRLIHFSIKRNSMKILIQEFTQNIWLTR